jgi:hypothetical protein
MKTKKSEKPIPCINCICLAICKADAQDLVKLFSNPINTGLYPVLIVNNLASKCSLIDEYSANTDLYSHSIYNRSDTQSYKVLEFLLPPKVMQSL